MNEMRPEYDFRGGVRGQYFSRYWRWRAGQTNPCICTPRVVVRQQPEWNPGRTLYGYGVAVTVRVHTDVCPLPDEVLHASAIKVGE